jgi:hypothetical protein
MFLLNYRGGASWRGASKIKNLLLRNGPRGYFSELGTAITKKENRIYFDKHPTGSIGYVFV